MKWEPTCDAIVTFPDALRWVDQGKARGKVLVIP